MNKTRFVAPSAILIYPPPTSDEILFIGENCWIGHFTILDGSEGLRIGNNCSIASGAHIYSHSTHLLTATLGERKTGAVTIGDNVAIGANSIIHYGCKIEDGAIIGALSQLLPHTHVKKGEFWAGNPAMLVRKMLNISSEKP